MIFNDLKNKTHELKGALPFSHHGLAYSTYSARMSLLLRDNVHTHSFVYTS